MSKLKGIELRTIQKNEENGDLEKAYIFMDSQKIGRVFFDKKVDYLNLKFYSEKLEIEFNNRILKFYEENSTFGVDLEEDEKSTKSRNLDFLFDVLFLKDLKNQFKNFKYQGKYGLAVLTSFKQEEKPFGGFFEIIPIEKWNKEVEKSILKEYPKCKYIRVFKSISDFNIK